MTEAWKVGDVAKINRRHPVEGVVGRVGVLKNLFREGTMWVVVMASDGDEILSYPYELERP